jgi:hypothetical protein
MIPRNFSAFSVSAFHLRQAAALGRFAQLPAKGHPRRPVMFNPDHKPNQKAKKLKR